MRYRMRSVLVRLTDAEFAALRRAAKRARRKVAVLVRDAIAREVKKCPRKRGSG